MKPITPADLQTILDSEIVWRRREIGTIINLIQTVESGAKAPLLRASVPLLYSHWEGFGKVCATRYLEHVSFKGIAFDQLRPSFTYISLLPMLQKIASGSVETGIELLQAAVDKISTRNRDNLKSRVNTRANLRFEVLREGMDNENDLSERKASCPMRVVQRTVPKHRSTRISNRH